MQTIEVVGKGSFSFPDEMSDDEIKAVLRRKFGGQNQQPPAPVEQVAAQQPEPAQESAFPFAAEDYSPEATEQHHKDTKGLARAVGQGATFGFADEAEAGIVSMLSNKTYKQARDEIRELNAEFAEKNPGIAMGAEVVGSVAVPGAIGVKAVQKLKKGFDSANATSKAGQTAQAVAKGAAVPGVAAAEGAIYAAGASDAEIGSDEYYDDAKTGATMGAAFAAGGQAAFKLADNLINNHAAKKLVNEVTPKIKELKAEAQAFYKQVKDSGAALQPGAYKVLVKNITKELEEQGYRPAQNTAIKTALDDMASEVGEAVPLTTVDSFRKNLRGAMGDLDANTARLAGNAVDKIDDFVEHMKPQYIIGDAPEQIADGYKLARQNWSKAKKAETIRDLFESADVQASGKENGVRIKMRAIYNNPRKRKLFTKEEQAAIKQVANGTPVQNVLKNVGKFGVSAGQQGQALLPALGALTGGAPVFIGASVAKHISESMTRKNAKRLEQIVLNGGDAEKVARVYVNSISAGDRSSKHLAELFEHASERELVALSKKVKEKTVKDAVTIALSVTSAGQTLDPQ